jgi:hypothetical protein
MIGHTSVPEGALERALEQVIEQRGERFASTIRAVICTNHERGRIRNFLNRNASAEVCDYVWHVVGCYDEWHEYVCQVQVEKATRVWGPLLEKLRAWAYAYLGRWELDGATRVECAMGFANIAGGEMVAAHFPFDTEFDGWACVLLQNVCRLHMNRINLWGVNERPVGWANVDEWLCRDLGSGWRDIELQVGRNYDLCQAIAQLTEKRQQIIVQRYFEGKSFADIGEVAGVDREVLYKRHFDALARLSDILSET